MAELETPTKRRLIATSTLGVGVLLVLALFLIVNYFGWKYHKRSDWTSEKLYSLSEKTLSVLESLEKDIEAIVFMSPIDELFDAVSELLSRYEASSPHLSIRYVDPEKNLTEAQSLVDTYEVSSLNVVVFDSGEDQRPRNLRCQRFLKYPPVHNFIGNNTHIRYLLNPIRSFSLVSRVRPSQRETICKSPRPAVLRRAKSE